jgi:P4 family phage/plasmid primase-like protien
MYKIIPVKGDPFVVNGEHILVVKATNMFHVSKREYDQYRAKWIEYDKDNILKNKSKSVNKKEEAIQILEDMKLNDKTVKKNDIIKMTVHQYLNLPVNIKLLLSIYRPEFVEFKSQPVKMDPWALGYWLGDGNSADPAFTTADDEVVDYFKNLCIDEKCQMNVYDDKGAAKTYGISGNIIGDNTIREALKEYKLFKNKHIPDEYKFNSKEVRMGVLAGLIDSDGHYQKAMKQIEITQKSEKLIDDIIWISRSLGLSCYKNKIKKQCVNNGVWGDYYRIQIVGEKLYEIPTIILRKQIDKRTCKRDPLMLGFKVERIEDNNFYGFELDGNHLFLAGGGDFTVLSNSNGKSKLIDLFQKAFGEYCCNLPITLLTQKRAAANAATSELARTKGKRFACLQEPSEDEKLNVGLMKELSGGDKIQARLLYKEPIEFKPQFRMILTCNHLPTVPSDDGGTWRRIRVAEFTSHFCESPELTNEFMIDYNLTDKFELWKEHFMALLIDKYVNTVSINGFKEPSEVMITTKEYQSMNDMFAEFVSNELELNEMSSIRYSDMMNAFKNFIKDNNIQCPASNMVKTAFIKNINKKMHRSVTCVKDIWKGCGFKTEGIANIADEVDN